MAPISTGGNLDVLARGWWSPVVRGLASIGLGLAALLAPHMGLLVLVTLWGLYAFLDGGFALVLAGWGATSGRHWVWLSAEGMLSIAAGVVSFVWPQITAPVLLGVIAAWALLTGIAELGAAVHLRRFVPGEWALVVSGLCSIALAVLLWLAPGAGTLAVLWLVGLYALAFGAALIALGLRYHGLPRQRRTRPPGAAPTLA